MPERVITLTILADNTAEPPFAAEHGFSALLEFSGLSAGNPGGYRLLFDTGRGALFPNAQRCGKNPADSDLIVLSHGHYDHTDALPAVLEQCVSAAVVVSEAFGCSHYSRSTGILRSISSSSAVFDALGALPPHRVLKIGIRLDIEDGMIGVAGHMPLRHPLETPSPLLYADAAGTIPDTVADELVLWFRTKNGVAVLTGCCHSGFINICEAIREVTGFSRIDTVIGGFHLSGVPRERLDAVCAYIRKTGISTLIPCHCTGAAETDYLRAHSGSTVLPGRCGFTCQFPAP